jgi:hypothetical protein
LPVRLEIKNICKVQVITVLNIIDDVKDDINSDNDISKKEKQQQFYIKKPFYDILGYSTSIAVEMTALANPNHMVIGQLIYDILDNNQKSIPIT